MDNDLNGSIPQLQRDRLPILARLRKSLLVQNVAALYGVHAVNYIIPLITVPFLTRTLGVAGWGGLAFAQSLGAIVVMVVEYGFTLSAGREVSIRRGDREYLASKLKSVTIAKIILLVIATVPSLIAYLVVPYLHQHPRLFCAGMIWAAAQGMNPLWLYQGLERIRLRSLVDVTFKFAGVIAIFALVRSPADDYIALTCYASASFASTAYLYFLALREFGMGNAAFGDVWHDLRTGLPLFMFQASVMLYTSANTFVLGLFVPVRIVGIYAGAERISRSALGLLGPMNSAIYPRINKVLAESREAAGRLLRSTFYVFAFVTWGLAAILVVSAPLVVRIFLGPQFTEAILPLRILALLLPVIGTSNVLGVHWMLPLHRDRAFTVIVLAAGILNLVLACIFAPVFAASGMASAVLCAETVVTLGCFVYLIRADVNPLWSRIPANSAG